MDAIANADKDAWRLKVKRHSTFQRHYPTSFLPISTESSCCNGGNGGSKPKPQPKEKKSKKAKNADPADSKEAKGSKDSGKAAKGAAYQVGSI